MIVVISDEAEADIADGSWFDELRQAGVDGYFHSCMVADIDSPSVYGGIHKVVNGYHRNLSVRFPFTIYYRVDDQTVTVAAILDSRREPTWIRRRLDG